MAAVTATKGLRTLACCSTPMRPAKRSMRARGRAGPEQLGGDQLDEEKKTEGGQRQYPPGIDGGGQQRRTQRRNPYPDIGNEAQNGRERGPQQGLRQADDAEPDPDRDPQPQVDRELRYEEPRQAFPRIVDRERRQPNIVAAGNANEAVAQGFVFEQNEHQDDQHDARGLDRHPDRAEHPFDDLHGIRWWLMQLDGDRSVRARERGLLQSARRLDSSRPVEYSRLIGSSPLLRSSPPLESSRLPGRGRASAREAPGLSCELVVFAHRNAIHRL